MSGYRGISGLTSGAHGFVNGTLRDLGYVPTGDHSWQGPGGKITISDFDIEISAVRAVQQVIDAALMSPSSDEEIVP